MRRRLILPVLVLGASILLGSCNYVKLLRPSVLKQLNPDVVRLLNELPAVDDPNEDIIARLFAHGGLAHANRGRDGVYRADIRVPDGELIWRPAIIRMETGGELELQFHNTDRLAYHAALLPSNGGRVAVQFGVGERASARIRLDGPGLYWFGCPVANHAG
ncbi:MAG TPA: MSMEG_3727 family PQQ-associated protein, partial [Rhodothermales bacterium]|nr:MSMEG_3727 family PQQ-associated protein [Rhodothermales bacterium]